MNVRIHRDILSHLAGTGFAKHDALLCGWLSIFLPLQLRFELMLAIQPGLGTDFTGRI
jgi:hypothetical protein